MTAVPRQNPSSTPAPVDTMLDGTGRKTSSASSPAMIQADVQPDACPAASHEPSSSNCFSNRRNGMMIAANIPPMSTVHRIDYLSDSTVFSYSLMFDNHASRGGMLARAQ